MKKIKDTEEYRTVMLRIMEYVDCVCRKNGLNCFLSGGTLLGAVRHKGFIPWDDDTDMMLLRLEYEKLTKLINQDESPYKVMRVSTEKEYYYPFAKVVDTRTGIIEEDRLPIENTGVGVDLFPIDLLPNDKRKMVRQFEFQKFLRKQFELFCCVNQSVINNKFLSFIYRKCLRLLSILMEHNAKNHQSVASKKAACVVWGYGTKEIIAVKDIRGAIDVEFEKKIFMAPIGYERYLSNLYGDYMTPPPKSKRHNEHRARVWYR